MQPYQWQSDIWQGLHQRIENDSVPHALLFNGASGVGKQHFAQAFVHFYFCRNPNGEQPCGDCDACHLLAIESHPDYKYIAPPEGKQNIAVDQIRELIEYVNLTPHSSRKKVAVINHAEKMNTYAANSLLKTLEEPPESAMLILITHNPDLLLPTIRSRCQKLLFPTPSTRQALDWLTTQIPDTKDAEALLALASNAPLKALEFAKQNVLQQRDSLLASIQDLFSGKQSAVSLASQLIKQDFDIMLTCISSWVMDMIRLKASEQPPKLANPDIRSQLLLLSQSVRLDQLLEYQKKLLKIHEWKKSNINTQMMIEEILISWLQICRK